MTKERTIDAVAKMIQLTQDGKLVWKEANVNIDQFPHLSDVADLTLLNVFEAEYNDTRLRLYKYKYTNAHRNQISIQFVNSSIEYFNHDKERENVRSHTKVALEIVGQNNKGLWSFPDVNILDDLFLVVQQQVAGVKRLFEELLKENAYLLN